MTPSDAASARPQLLLIDDDRKLTRLLIGFLDMEGFDVSAAYDGAEGLSRAKSQKWDLILLDLMLPGIDGHEVLAQLRRVSQVPVLMLTGRGSEEDLIAGLGGGADDYVPKTASSRELCMRIRALLRRSAIVTNHSESISEPQEIRVGSLTIQLAARFVSVDQKPAQLTAVEYDLLLLLIGCKGHICSRKQLMNGVRQRDFGPFDRTIDVHVASLRKKLGDDARTARFIRTVRSVGYIFIDPEAEAS